MSGNGKQHSGWRAVIGGEGPPVDQEAHRSRGGGGFSGEANGLPGDENRAVGGLDQAKGRGVFARASVGLPAPDGAFSEKAGP